MKVEFLMALSGVDGVHESGSKAEVPDAEALRLIDAGIAMPANKKEHDVAVKKAIAAEEAELEKQKEVEVALYREELEAEKAKLEERVKEIEDLLK